MQHQSEESFFSGPILTADPERPFLEHLEELRRRILRCFLWIGLGTAVSLHYSHTIVNWLTQPAGKLVFLNPTEPLMVHLKAAFFGGLFLSMPLVTWEVWGFVAPALNSGERKPVLFLMPLSAALFLCGSWFGWFIVVPTSLKFLLSFSSDSLVPMLTVGSYVTFASWLVIGCGLIFQMPMVVAFLARWGILKPSTLLRQWRLAVVAIFIVAAILTPTPDVVNQTLLALPMIVLYIISVGVAFLVRRPGLRENKEVLRESF